MSVIYDNPRHIPENGFPSLDLQKESQLSFYVSEKIDGCNIGMFVPKEGAPYFFSRNGEDANGLYDFDKDKHQLKRFVECVQGFINTDAIDEENVEGLYFWGEYFGNRINRRINYGDAGQIRFYDAMVVTTADLETRAPVLLTPLMFMFLCVQINLYATNNGYFKDFKDNEISWEFLYPADYDFESASKSQILENFNPDVEKSHFAIDGGHPEGYVVTAAVDEKIVGRWKIKSEKFVERARQPKMERVVDDEQVYFRSLFYTYINVNRAKALLSKTTERSMKALLPQFIQDAKDDFLEEHPEVKEKEPKWLKAIFNAGKLPYTVMTEAIQQEIAK